MSVLYFCRQRLTQLYLHIEQRKPANNQEGIFVAYSKVELDEIRRVLPASNVLCFPTYAQLIKQNSLVDYEGTFAEIDRSVSLFTSGELSAFGIMQNDRSLTLNSEKIIYYVVNVYLFWRKIFEHYDIKYAMHETPSLAFNYILCIVCQERGCSYVSNAQLPGPDKRFIAVGNVNAELVLKNKNTVQGFNEFLVHLGTTSATLSYENKFSNSILNILKNIAMSIYSAFLLLHGKLTNQNEPLKQYMRHEQIKNVILYLRRSFLTRYINYANIRQIPTNKRILYYSMSLEPEGNVLYWGRGKYAGQIELLISIARCLPSNFVIVVKDHPHKYGNRPLRDFLRLLNIPNIYLLNPNLNASVIVENADAVCCIYGTVILEAIAKGKRCFMFGRHFYQDSNLCSYVSGPEDLVSQLTQKNLADGKQDIEFLKKLYSSSYLGDLGFFNGEGHKNKIEIDPKTQEGLGDFVEMMSN